MDNRKQSLTQDFTRWLDRYSPRRALQQQPTALEAEIKALMRVIFKMAPLADYLAWLDRVTTQLDYQMKTAAWPTVSEVGAVCSNINKSNAQKSPTKSQELSPSRIAAQRMVDGKDVGDGWLYGRSNLEMMKLGIVGGETLRKYRTDLYFSAKKVYGEEAARRMESGWLERHRNAERLHAKMSEDEMPTKEPFRRMPVSADDQYPEYS